MANMSCNRAHLLLKMTNSAFDLFSDDTNCWYYFSSIKCVWSLYVMSILVTCVSSNICLID
jgi:hypothetical protein